MKAAIGIWTIIFVSLQLLFQDCLAVYPAPGSYYSVLLRYNNRGKNRKEARIAPSPLRLWAVFDPPAALGSLPIEAIDNNLRERTKVERITKANKENENFEFTKVEEIQKLQTKINKTDQKIKTERTAEIRSETNVNPIKRQSVFKNKSGNVAASKNVHVMRIQKQSNNVKTDLEESAKGSCGGYYKVILNPVNYVPDKQGRFFHETVQSVGFPEFYEAGKECIWNIDIGNECQMGMIMHEIYEGNLMQSRRCLADSLRLMFNGVEKERLCGALGGLVSYYKWTKGGEQNLKISLESHKRDGELPPGKKWGLKFSLSGYCWVYSNQFLSMSKPNPSIKKTKLTSEVNAVLQSTSANPLTNSLLRNSTKFIFENRKENETFQKLSPVKIKIEKYANFETRNDNYQTESEPERTTVTNQFRTTMKPKFNALPSKSANVNSSKIKNFKNISTLQKITPEINSALNQLITKEPVNASILSLLAADNTLNSRQYLESDKLPTVIGKKEKKKPTYIRSVEKNMTKYGTKLNSIGKQQLLVTNSRNKAKIVRISSLEPSSTVRRADIFPQINNKDIIKISVFKKSNGSGISKSILQSSNKGMKFLHKIDSKSKSEAN